MNLHLRPAAGLLLAGLVLAACSGSAATPAPTVGGAGPTAATGDPSAPPAAAAASTAPAAGGATIDACSLVTEQEATTFLGSDPGAGLSTGTADQPACAYGASLTLSIQPSAGKAQYDADRGAAQGSGKSTDLTGVGDAAFAFVVANTIGQMEIVKGAVVVTLNIQGDPSLQNITVDRLTTLGTVVAGRM
ncbi:MAG TPA: DUF3558 family protein [Candidatus Limnocylindrales bacterium]|nr:DUF3558 family protein [Candidatus Limnocylindrales bacterium]